MPVTLSEMKARLSLDRKARVEQRTAEIVAEVRSLRALRLARASTQVEVAERLHVSQANVAKLEQRADILLSTLREYVEALGGHLDLVARFDDNPDPVFISQLADIPPADEETPPRKMRTPKRRRARVSKDKAKKQEGKVFEAA
jgi:transcriptional regulator with XRE-family HTH domain